jgi:AsmA protein
VSGTGNVTLDLTGLGANLGDVRRGLDGDVSFALTDGAWQGMDLWYELRRARAVLNGNAPPTREGARETAFSEVRATGVIEDAVLVNRDLTAVLPFMRVTGSGSANLITDALDFNLTAQFVDGPAMQADPSMADLAGTSLPFTIGGTLDAPSVRPDFEAVVRARVQQEVEERVQQEVDQQIEERTDELRDRLRGIFNR